MGKKGSVAKVEAGRGVMSFRSERIKEYNSSYKLSHDRWGIPIGSDFDLLVLSVGQSQVLLSIELRTSLRTLFMGFWRM